MVSLASAEHEVKLHPTRVATPGPPVLMACSGASLMSNDQRYAVLWRALEPAAPLELMSAEVLVYMSCTLLHGEPPESIVNDNLVLRHAIHTSFQRAQQQIDFARGQLAGRALQQILQCLQ